LNLFSENMALSIAATGALARNTSRLCCRDINHTQGAYGFSGS